MRKRKNIPRIPIEKFFKIFKVIKNKEKLRNCQSQEEIKETWLLNWCDSLHKILEQKKKTLGKEIE